MAENVITKYVYLNTSNPETFINVSGNDVISVNTGEDSFTDFYINAVYVDYFKQKNESDSSILNLTIDENANNTHVLVFVNPKTTSIKEFTVTHIHGEEQTDYKCFYNPVISGSENSRFENLNTINNDRSSFMILRTNPKLTGNIKLVVDSSNNMYLDTFKVSPTLSEKRYRHALISGKSYFSNDVKNIFETLPKTDLYKIPEDGYDLFNVKKELSKQYNDIYSYGVKNNNDKLYPENFSLLAPLYINETLPDFFLIFRVDGAMSENDNMSATDRMQYFIKNGKLVKSFDMRRNTPIGNYLRNIQSELQQYHGSVYISCDDYNYNNWIGISVDNGIISQANETTYRLSKVKNQVELDNYITNGFERNGLINSRIINFEFMFDDNDAPEFSINRYFGLYIKNNEYKKIFVVNSVNNNENSLISSEILDEQYNVISDINNSITSLDDILKNDRIFNITTDVSISNNCYRFNSDPLVILDDQYKNIPYKNILTTPVIEEVIEDKNSGLNTQFITITINEPLTPGEHLRIIDTNIYDNSNIKETEYQHSSEVFEVVAGKVDIDRYFSAEEYFDINNDELINYKDLYFGNILDDESQLYLENENIRNKETLKIHRNIFAGYSELENVFGTTNKDEIIKIQIKQIVDAFNSLSDKTFVISNYDDKNISFMANDAVNFLRFERISSKVIHKNENIDTLKDEEFLAEDIKKVTYFNNFEIPGTILSLYNKVNIENAAFIPTDFEVWSDRLAYIVSFAKTDTGIDINSGRINSGFIYNIPIEHYSNIDKISLFKNTNDEYVKINDFNIQYFEFENDGNDNAILKSKKYTDDLTNVVKSYKSSNMYIITTDMKAYIHNNELNIYSIAPVHLNIAGIMPVKDFNFNVLDKTNFIGSNSLNCCVNGVDEYDLGYSDANYIYYTVLPNDTITLSANKKYKIISGTGRDINTDEEYNNNSDMKIKEYILKNIKSTNLVIGLDIEDEVNVFTRTAARNSNSDESLINYFDLNDNGTITNTGNLNSFVKKLYNEKSTADIPLIIPTNAKWRINGLDIYGNKIKFGLNYNNSLTLNSYNLLSNDDGELFGYPIYKSLSTDKNSNYIFNDIMDLTYCNDGKLCTFKDKILYNGGSIDELIYTNGNSKSKFSKLYYNYDLNSLETIICGKKLYISSIDKAFDIKKYNNYLFTFICSPSVNDTNKQIDIIIDEISNIVLCVWYLGTNNLSYTYRNSILFDNVYINDTKDDTNTKYTHYKNIIDLSNSLNNVFPFENNNKTYTDENAPLFINAINFDTDNVKENYTFEIKDPSYNDDYICSNNNSYFQTCLTYNNVLEQNVDKLNIENNIIKFTDNKVYAYVLDASSSFNININDINNILNDNLAMIYIKSKNGTQTINKNFIKFDFIDYIHLLDKNINVYSGYCDPEFINIFEFENNETENIINYTNKNYISGNTRISNVNYINQLWINKVSDMTDYVLNGNIEQDKIIPFISIDVIHNFDITKSSWDNNFFRKYYRNNDDEYYKHVNGYENGVNVKNFFGSNGIKLTNKPIVLSSWNYYSVDSVLKHFNESSDNIDKFLIKIDITSELLDKILNNKNFISNWNSNVDIKYAVEYAKNLLNNNYIINNKNIVNVFKKTLGTYINDPYNILISYNKDDSSFVKIDNIHSKIYKENEKYYLELEVSNALDSQYAIEYTLNRN